MSVLLTLPRLGETMESGRVVGWLKRPGETFRRGETLVEIESDKTVVELPALADGRLLEVIATEGREVEGGAPLGRSAAGDAAAPPPAPPTQPPPPAPGARQRATPAARRMARAQGIDLAAVQGSGRRGRIERSDLRATETEALAVRRWPSSTQPRCHALLLHGFGGDAQTWAPLASLLAQHGIAVTAPDLPAHGATALEAADIAGLAAPLAALLDGTKGELIGHSMGAAVAVALARAHPERIARLTLIAPAGLDAAIDADFIQGIATARNPGGLAHLLRRLSVRPLALSTTPLARMAEAFAAGRLHALAATLVADGRQQIDIVADLAALPMPVRVVWGLEDRIIPWTQVARLPSPVAVHLIANAGHMPHWDAPQQVAALFPGSMRI
jgi:pyruvate dehydrogenase E2 component (dihydrolipoamide acetyltransferase)